MRWKSIVLFLVIVFSVACEELCTNRVPTNISTSLLRNYCEQRNGSMTSSRICSSGNDVIIGHDLSNCDLTKIDINATEIRELEWLAINGNPLTLKKLIDGMRSAVNLSIVLINADDRCVKFSTNKTLGNVTECLNPTNVCEIGEKCPANSHCTYDGPGLFACPCKEGWQSYKCLKEKDFPYIQWLTSIAAGTVFLCAIVRFLQRNDRKSGAEYRKLQNTNRNLPNSEHLD